MYTKQINERIIVISLCYLKASGKITCVFSLRVWVRLCSHWCLGTGAAFRHYYSKYTSTIWSRSPPCTQARALCSRALCSRELCTLVCMGYWPSVRSRWLSGKFFLRDTAGIPEQARWLHLARSGSQSQRRIWFILPAHGGSHIINVFTFYFVVKNLSISKTIQCVYQF